MVEPDQFLRQKRDNLIEPQPSKNYLENVSAEDFPLQGWDIRRPIFFPRGGSPASILWLNIRWSAEDDRSLV